MPDDPEEMTMKDAALPLIPHVDTALGRVEKGDMLSHPEHGDSVVLAVIDATSVGMGMLIFPNAGVEPKRILSADRLDGWTLRKCDETGADAGAVAELRGRLGELVLSVGALAKAMPDSVILEHEGLVNRVTVAAERLSHAEIEAILGGTAAS
jgi:hypothetical protein